MSQCCKHNDVTSNTLPIEGRIRAFVLRRNPWMHRFLIALYALVALAAVFGLSTHIFK
jgi:hypothetical protein